MKVLILEIPSIKGRGCVNKDLAGGMGTRTLVGDSWRARIFEYVKMKNVVLPNIAIAYLVAIFKDAGWEVERKEFVDHKDSIENNFDLVLSPVSIVDHENELNILQKIKSKGIPIGVFGTFASAQPELFLKVADFVIQGEPEAAALQMIKTKKIPIGIFVAGQIEDINQLPFPDWSQFPVEKYSYSPALNKKPFVTMLTSRGCPFSCSYYCPYTIQAGKRWRFRSVDNIIREIEYLVENFQIKAIDFRDATFTLDRERIAKFCQKIINKKIDIIWSCETRLDRLDIELIDLMFEAGLRNINVGIESINFDVLRGSKRVSDDMMHQEKTIDYCQKKGITIAAFYTFGLEEDTEESIIETIKYAKKLNTLVAQFHISTPYPGTDFFNKIKEAGSFLTEDWNHYNGYTPVYQHEKLSPDKLLRLKEKAFVSYYFRLPYLFRHIPKYVIEKYLWPF